uniref:NADH-ubiquinone oxidoreductase chain 2 n=1 Tax=Orthione mesoamericana TaxID=2480053 RepID=A0A8K1Y3I2_9CRUS|nr:NADH dehydrogenase subunit 2 [Orthione mesoamericana]
MVFTLFSSLCMTILPLSIVISISSDSWLGAWVGLELNTMAFISILAFDEKVMGEAKLKYFLVQSVSSFMLLLGGLLPFLKIGSCIIIVSLLFKAGLAPLHFWFPPIVKTLSWFATILLLTVQKFIPLSLLSYSFSSDSELLLKLAVLSCAGVGALGGFGELHLRKLLSFSSISHGGWILVSFFSPSALWVLYYLMYCYFSGMTMLFLMNLNKTHMVHMEEGLLPLEGVFFSCLLLALGGMPPLAGFYPKLLVLSSLINMNTVMLVLMLMFSIVTLFYYVRVSFPLILMSSVNYSSSAGSVHRSTMMLGSATLWGLPVLIMFV